MRLRQYLLGALAAMLWGSLASAQVVTTGTIIVVVEAEDGARLPGATVTVMSADTHSKREAVSDAKGEAQLLSLEPSSQYTVTVSMPQFATVKNEKILVRSGQITTLPRIAQGELGQRGDHGHRRDPARGHHQRHPGPGHHARADRVAAHRAAATRATFSSCLASPLTTRTPRPATRPRSPASTTRTSPATSASRPTTSTTSTAST